MFKYVCWFFFCKYGDQICILQPFCFAITSYEPYELCTFCFVSCLKLCHDLIQRVHFYMFFFPIVSKNWYFSNCTNRLCSYVFCLASH